MMEMSTDSKGVGLLLLVERRRKEVDTLNAPSSEGHSTLSARSIDKNVSLDFRMMVSILIKDSAVKFGNARILMKKGNAMIRRFIFKIFLDFGRRIQNRNEWLLQLSPGPPLAPSV